jgi:small-conductance mechanosensitive channel
VSRTRSSSIRQTLAVRYDDMDRLPKLCQDIKEEIREAVGDLLITEGRPFRVIWRDFKNTYLEVFVLAFLKVKPNGNDYYDAQEKVLQAISRAMEKNGCEFSYTDFINPRGANAYEMPGEDESSLLVQPGGEP